jgi:hypothetical protein
MKVVIKHRKWKQKGHTTQRSNNDQQNTTQKTKD